MSYLIVALDDINKELQQQMEVLTSEIREGRLTEGGLQKAVRSMHLKAGQIQDLVHHIVECHIMADLVQKALETGNRATQMALMATGVQIIGFLNAKSVDQLAYGTDEGVIRDLLNLLEYTGPKSGQHVRKAIAAAHVEYATNH